jgi:hypothetical protein
MHGIPISTLYWPQGAQTEACVCGTRAAEPALYSAVRDPLQILHSEFYSMRMGRACGVALEDACTLQICDREL